MQFAVSPLQIKEYQLCHFSQLHTCYDFFIFTIFELSKITSLQLLQRQEIFDAGRILRLIVFSRTESMLENNPGFFSVFSRQIMPRLANDNPVSITF
jgi:hypothetical protein